MAQFAATADGTPIAYDVMGEGPNVLLVHGFASDRFQNWRDPGWYKILTEAGYRVAAFDFRGHGESGKPHNVAAYGLNMLDDLLAVMDAAEMPSAHVMGYSMGTYYTTALMKLHPERVKSAVLGGMGESYFSAAGRDHVNAALSASDLSELSNPTDRQFFKFLRSGNKDPIALKACFDGNKTIYSREELKTILHPVLIVAGDRDDVAGDPVPLAESFGNARALVLANKDHMSAVGDKANKLAVLEFFAAQTNA